MHFVTAGIYVNPLVPPLVAFCISLFTSMAGVSGAFMLLPFQMDYLGFTSPAVTPTNHLYNIVATPGGVYRYIREGRMVWPLALVVVAGTIPGVLGGVYIRVRYLPDPAEFKMFAGVVLLYLGCRLVYDMLGKKASLRSAPPQKGMRVLSVSPYFASILKYEFDGKTYSVSAYAVFIMSLLVGAAGGIYGIGGGSIISPFFVAYMGLPVYTVAGAVLLSTFVTSLFGVVFFLVVAPYYPHMAVAPDLMLGLFFGVGGLAGSYLGAMAQKKVPERAIKGILAFCTLFVALKYLLGSLR